MRRAREDCNRRLADENQREVHGPSWLKGGRESVQLGARPIEASKLTSFQVGLREGQDLRGEERAGGVHPRPSEKQEQKSKGAETAQVRKGDECVDYIGIA